MSRKLGKKDRPGTPPIFSVKFSANIKYSAEHQSQKQILKKVNFCGALNFKEQSGRYLIYGRCRLRFCNHATRNGDSRVLVQ